MLIRLKGNDMLDCKTPLLYSWERDDVKKILKHRVIERTKISKGLDITEHDVNEEQISNEYHTIWLEAIRRKDKYNMLYNHPMLLQEDYEYIWNQNIDYRMKKLKWSFIGTGVVLFIYSLGFKRRWYFYNKFNKRRIGIFKIFGPIRKIFFLYLTFQANFWAATYLFNQQFYVALKNQGLYAKYNLSNNFSEFVE